MLAWYSYTESSLHLLFKSLTVPTFIATFPYLIKTYTRRRHLGRFSYFSTINNNYVPIVFVTKQRTRLCRHTKIFAIFFFRIHAEKNKLLQNHTFSPLQNIDAENWERY